MDQESRKEQTNQPEKQAVPVEFRPGHFDLDRSIDYLDKQKVVSLANSGSISHKRAEEILQNLQKRP